MNTQYGNTGSFADHGANNDYDVEVVVEPADEAVEVSVADDYEIEIEILGAEYADADAEVSLFDGDDDFVLIDVVSEDGIDAFGGDDGLIIDDIDDAFDIDNPVDVVDDVDTGGDFM